MNHSTHQTASPLGVLMVDVAGTTLTEEERAFLRHPQVGSVILFARNYQDPAQLCALTADIKSLRTPALPITVDHEGGRVQRFREGFTAIPPMRAFGDSWQRDAKSAIAAAAATGFIIGYELVSSGVDFSFTPVLDLDYGHSTIIGDRAFSGDPEVVSTLALSLMRGLRRAGVGAVGKHFPGHGYVAADSHVDVPRDPRTFEQIESSDLVPFQRLIDAGLMGIMPAHVIYDAVDARPAGFSRHWIRDVLRKRMRFNGVVFSDDLSMEGAGVVGGYRERALAALDAGCNVLPVCNVPDEARALADALPAEVMPMQPALAARMSATSSAVELKRLVDQYDRAKQDLARLMPA